MQAQHPLLRRLSALTLGCAIAFCAHGANKPESSAKPSGLDSMLFYQLLLGELSARTDDAAAAFSLVFDAARKTGDAAVYRRAVQLAIQARAGESALQAANAWSEAIPSSSEANLFVLQILLGLNRVAQTTEPIRRGLALTPVAQQRDFLWGLPQLFERVGDRQLAATTVQAALKTVADDKALGATANAVIGRMWLSAGNKSVARAAAEKGLRIDVKDEHPAVLALSMLSADSDVNEPAQALVKQHLPHARAAFRIAYVKSLLSAHRALEAQSALEALKSAQPDFAEAWLISGTLALQRKQLDQAQTQFQRYLDLIDAGAEAERTPQVLRARSQALMSMAQIAQLRGDFAQAEAWLKRVDSPEDLVRAQIQRANLMAQQGQLEDALALIQSQPEGSPADARLKRSAEIALLREQKQFDRARERLITAINLNPHDTDLIYDLAMVNEKLGDLAGMEKLLRDLIASRPDDPQAYNALGYSLADRNLRLPEARALVAKALELSPGDPFITDSLAWVAFREGNHAQALQLLQAAFKEKPDAEIAAHLGEVLWVLQRQHEALEVFRQGVNLNPDNETLLETIKRLNVTL